MLAGRCVHCTLTNVEVCACFECKRLWQKRGKSLRNACKHRGSYDTEIRCFDHRRRKLTLISSAKNNGCPFTRQGRTSRGVVLAGRCVHCTLTNVEVCACLECKKVWQERGKSLRNACKLLWPHIRPRRAQQTEMTSSLLYFIRYHFF